MPKTNTVIDELCSSPCTLLIVAAARNEVAALKPLDAFTSDDKQFSFTLLTNSGDFVGAVPLAVAMMKAAARSRFDYAVNIGFCGARDPSLAIGENVIVTHDTFFDYGFMRPTGFIPLCETPFPMPHADTHGWLVATSPNLLHLSPNTLRTVNGYTVSHPSTGAQISSFGSPFPPNAAVETMEGAAFAYTASALAIPTLAIRTVSNYCALGDAAQWNIQKAQLGVRKALSDALQIIKLDLQTHKK